MVSFTLSEALLERLSDYWNQYILWTRIFWKYTPTSMPLSRYRRIVSSFSCFGRWGLDSQMYFTSQKIWIQLIRTYLQFLSSNKDGTLDEISCYTLWTHAISRRVHILVLSSIRYEGGCPNCTYDDCLHFFRDEFASLTSLLLPYVDTVGIVSC